MKSPGKPSHRAPPRTHTNATIGGILLSPNVVSHGLRILSTIPVKLPITANTMAELV